MSDDNKKLLLIDGNSIMNRAFFGIRELTNSKGIHTNAIYGFLNILLRTIENEKATHMAVAFDLKAPTFRHVMFDGYKGNRKGMPDELREQMPLIKELLGKMNVPICEMEGFEADDVLGTVAYKGEREGYDVTVLSGDRDMLQVATDKIKITIPKTSKGTTTYEEYFTKQVEEKYMVTPKEFIDVKGLMGDSSDNIPGIAGIGEKTATKWINKYKSIEGVFENSTDFTKKQQEKLDGQLEIALLSRTLATIKLDCEVDIDLSTAALEDIFNEAAYDMFKDLELKTFYNRFEIESHSSEDDMAAFRILKVDNVYDLRAIVKASKEVSYQLYQDPEYTGLYVHLGTTVFYMELGDYTLEEIYDVVRIILSVDSTVITTFDLKKQLHQISDVTEHTNVLDLTLMAYLDNPNADGYDVEHLANGYIGRIYPSIEELLGKGKSKKSMMDIELEQRTNYLALGTYYLSLSGSKMTEALDEKGMMKLYKEIELPLLYVLKSMEAIGVKVDVEALKAYQAMLGEKIEVLQKAIYEIAGQEFNINSPKQLGVILFEVLELPIIKKTKTGYSTAADVLEKLKEEHEIIEQIMSYRTLAKLKSTYADGLFQYIGDDERIHTTFSQKTASTGRLSSVDPNLQNIPIRMAIGREIRKVFVPKEGYVFVDADYSQIELRLLAHLSEDETFIKAFNDNEDIHRITASRVFHIPFEEVDEQTRRNAKAVNFGIVYGISPFGLSQDLDISVKEASNYINQYFEKYPKVKEFLDKTIEDAKATGYTKTMYDRIRQIPELSSSNFMQRSFGERIAMNTPIQGSAADIMKIAMIKVYNRLKDSDYDADLILTVHDELLLEVPEADAEKIQAILVDEMEAAASISVPLTVDAHTGKNWFDAK